MENNELIQKKIEAYKKELLLNKYTKICAEKAEKINDEDLLFIKYALEQSGEFIAHRRGDLSVWDVTTNPNYKINNSVISTNKIQRTSIYITSAVIIASAFIQYFDMKINETNKFIQEKQDKKDSMQQKTDSIQKLNQIKELELIRKSIDSLRK